MLDSASPGDLPVQALGYTYGHDPNEVRSLRAPKHARSLPGRRGVAQRALGLSGFAGLREAGPQAWKSVQRLLSYPLCASTAPKQCTRTAFLKVVWARREGGRLDACDLWAYLIVAATLADNVFLVYLTPLSLSILYIHTCLWNQIGTSALDPSGFS